MVRARRLHVLLVIVAACVVMTRRTVAAGTTWQLCGDACSEYSDCTTQCFPTQFDLDQGQNETTCDGWSQANSIVACDYSSYDDCNYVCSATDGSASTSCSYWGTSTTCGDLGIYEYCGDGVCGADEDAASCSDDCGVAPTEDNIDLGAVYTLVDDIDAAGGWDSSDYGAAAIQAEVTYDDGWVDDPGDVGDSFDQPLDCVTKYVRESGIAEALKSAKFLGTVLAIADPLTAGAFSWAQYINGNAVADLQSQLDTLDAQPCYWPYWGISF